jgi:hypothetical protein
MSALFASVIHSRHTRTSPGIAQAAQSKARGLSIVVSLLFVVALGTPPRQNSCRPDRTKNPGAMMRERVGSIRTSIQGQSGGTVATTTERATGGGVA